VDGDPLWVTLLVGLGAGVVGSFLSTTLRIRHEREADLRQRMLDCADSFCAIAGDAIDGVRDIRAQRAMAARGRSFWANVVAAPAPPEVPEPELSTARATDAFGRLVDAEPRLRLLFGPRSDTARDARALWKHLHEDIEADKAAFKKEVEVGTREITVKDAFELAALLDAMCESARKDIRRGSGIKRR
jgi:hypothetical protein